MRQFRDAVSQGHNGKPISLVSSVNPDLLLSLIRLKRFDGVTSIDDLTDDTLQEWFEGKVDSVLQSYTTTSLLADVKKFVRVNIYEADPELRMINAFADYDKFLRRRNLECITQNNPKLATSHICSILRPMALRRKVESDLAIHKAELKRDWQKFFDYVIEEAVACDRFVSVKDAEGFKPGSTRSSDKLEKATTQTLNKSTDRDGKEKTGSTIKSEHSAEFKPTLPYCLNRETCEGKRHLIKDCPHADDEKRRKLIEAFKAKKSVGLVRRFHTDNINISDGRIPTLLMDAVDVTVSGDYGADRAAVCEKHLQALASRNIFVPVLPLSTPVVLDLAVSSETDAYKVAAKRKARLSLTLQLPEGPMRLRNVEFLVLDQDMPDVLLSRPLLHSLGFNLDSHLARVRERYHDADFAHVTHDDSSQSSHDSTSTTCKLASLLQRNNEDKAQSQDSQDCNPGKAFNDVPNSRTHIAEDVAPALENIVKEAKANGLTNNNVTRLKKLLDKYVDIFRLKLGSDPAVKVAPMRIQLRENAVPTRVKPRRYSEDQL